MPIQLQGTPSRHILSDNPPLDPVAGRVGPPRAMFMPVLAGSATLVLAVIALWVLIAALPAREVRTPSQTEATASVPAPLTKTIEQMAPGAAPVSACGASVGSGRLNARPNAIARVGRRSLQRPG